MGSPSEQYAKELMKPVRKPTQYSKVVSAGINDILGLDLADMAEWHSSNDGYKFIMVIVDVFSRYAWCIPLKTKTAQETWDAIKPVLEKTKPRKLWTDDGGEFRNAVWDSKLKQMNIVRYSTYGPYKVSIAERFIRTLKTALWFHFVKDNTRRWVDVLDDVVSKYNKRVHSSLGVTPTQAQKKKYESELLDEQYESPEPAKPKYKLGDWVRISRSKGTFEKGIFNWSYEIFKVVSRSLTAPVLYQLVDYYGEPVTGSFYENELQFVEDPSYFPVEKLTGKKRTYRGEKQVLAKLLGYKNPVWLSANSVDVLS